MAKQARQSESVTERNKRIADENRAEANSRAHDAAPFSAGEELAEGSDARKAKLAEAKKKG